MKFYRKTLGGSFNRICRIQINSSVKPQNVYFNHYYKIKCKLGGIYNPNNADNVLEKELEIYCNSTDQYYYTNTRNFYCKLTTDNDNVYLDIGISHSYSYDDMIIEVETPEPGNVTFFGDVATIGEYTRIDYLAGNIKMCAKNIKLFAWTGANQSKTITVSKFPVVYIDPTNNIFSVTQSSDIINADNSSWTITETSSNDFNRVMNIACKRNTNLTIII